MLKFRAIESTDIPIIREFTHNSGVQSCDFTLSGVYLWGIYYKYEICIYKDTLFIRGIDESGRISFGVPFGALSTEEGVEVVCEYCRAHNLKPHFFFVPECKLTAYKNAEIRKLEGWSDYVYDAESLSTLAGKKLHKKKNRFNKFVKTYPNHCLKRASGEDIEKLRKFYSGFLSENPADSERLAAEESIINRIFDEYDKLGMEIGVLWVEDKIVAFAVGERIGETLYVHFEKALRSYDGSFEAINCLFVREFKGNAKYVDREEDMNDLGLRQAKMAYNPVYLVDKYVVLIPEAESTNG